MKRYVSIIILAAVATVCCKWAMTERREKQRHMSNEHQLLHAAETLTTNSGKHVMEVQRLMLERQDLEKSQQTMLGQIEDLKIRNRRIESLLQAATNTAQTVRTVIRDTVIYVPVKDTSIHVQVFDWSDAWTSIHGQIAGSDVELQYSSHDTLTFAAHRVPRRLLFIRWGTKAVRMDAVSANPNTKLTYAISIQLVK
jgi:hypothetical protein